MRTLYKRISQIGRICYTYEILGADEICEGRVSMTHLCNRLKSNLRPVEQSSVSLAIKLRDTQLATVHNVK